MAEVTTPVPICGMVPLAIPEPKWWANVRSLDADMGLPMALANKPTATWLSTMNSWVNRTVDYVADTTDHWQSPRETMLRRAGDCEDFCILKRQLRRSCLPRDARDAWVTLVYDLLTRQQHAILVTADGQMLDNRTNLILDAASAKDYLPIMALGDTCWLYVRPRRG